VTSQALQLRLGAAWRRRATSSWLRTDRRLARLGDGLQKANDIGPFDRHGEKEPQRGDGGVDRRGARRPLRHIQLITAKVLARRRIRQPTEEGCELPHIANIVLFVCSLNRRAVMSSIKR
jgi:hypothetical protein